MTSNMSPWIVLLTILSLHPVYTVALAVDPELKACISKNAPKSTTIQQIRLRSEGRMFEEKILAAQMYWKRVPAGTSNLLAVFDEPEDISGSRLLFLEKTPDNEIYLYMPGLLKARRISSKRVSSSMYGMDFSYDDFHWLYNMLSTADSEQREDAELNGQPVYVLAVTPGEEGGSKYESVVSYFDKPSCVIRQVEFYENGGRLRKRLLVEPGAIKTVSGIMIPHKFLMQDLKKNSETELTVTAVKVDPDIPDSIFEPARLKDFSGIE